METLASSPSNEYFLMGGRLRGGKWNAAIFDAESGDNLHSIDTQCRMTDAFFTSDGNRLVTVGCKRQPEPKNGKFGPWGTLEIHDIESA